MLLVKHIDVCFDFTTICFVTTRRLNLTTESNISVAPSNNKRRIAACRCFSPYLQTKRKRPRYHERTRPTSPRSDHSLSLLRRGLCM